MDFIMPGLVMMSIITNSYNNVVSSFYGAKYSRHIEEMQVAPVPNLMILLGFVTGGVARGLLRRYRGHAGVAAVHRVPCTIPGDRVAGGLLTSCLFALAGLINAIFANSFDDITIIPTFVLTPLTYLGGIFYSIRMLPEIWQQCIAGQPDPVHGQQLSLRLSRQQRHRAAAPRSGHPVLHRAAVRSA